MRKFLWCLFSAACHIVYLAILHSWRGPVSPPSPAVEVFVAEEQSPLNVPGIQGETGFRQKRASKLNSSRLSYGSGIGPVKESRVDSLTAGESSVSALNQAQDRQFSQYLRIYRQVEGELTYPDWLKARESGARVQATLTFLPGTSGAFRLAVSSESSLLRVHVTKLFRALIASDLPQALKGLEHSPIYFYFTFSETGLAEVEIDRLVQNNRLYFERGGRQRPGTIQMRATTPSSRQAEPANYVELSLLGLLGSANQSEDTLQEEEYRADPAYRAPEALLTGYVST